MTHRLAITYFAVPSDRCSNGQRRPAGILAEAAFTVGGDFYCRARVIKPQSQPARLEVEPIAIDLLLQRPEPFPFSEDLRAMLYQELGRRYGLAKARQYSRMEGRN